MPKCPHCDRPVKAPSFTYPKSGVVACLECVSQPNADTMDQLLMNRALERLVTKTQTGRLPTTPNRASRPRHAS